MATILERKKWTLQHGKIANPDEKFVIPKRDIFKQLSEAHSAIAHWGRDKTERHVGQSSVEFHKPRKKTGNKNLTGRRKN